VIVKYEITVQQIDEAGEYVDGFEMRMRVTPEAVARIMPGLLAESVGAERVAVTTVMPSDVPAAGQAEPPKRTRRTKAQIAADELAQQQAASAAPAPGGPAPQPTENGASAPAVAPPAAAPATATPAVPYDPFAPK
jgi:hypothetical protein